MASPGDHAVANAGEIAAHAAALAALLERGQNGQRGRASGDAPTPETKAKLAQDTVRHMLAKGTLLAEHADAAEEIRDVFEAVTAGLGPSARRLTPDAATERTRRRYVQPVERLPERMRRQWRERYKPWADGMQKVVVAGAGSGACTALNLVIDVVVDGRGLLETDRRLGVRKGTAAMHFRAALHRYAVMAGWLPQGHEDIIAPESPRPFRRPTGGASERRPGRREQPADLTPA